ncbi:MAG: ABC transporter ATP-binding protein [Alphaproteobacteria bacterium]|nr:ABC transporter ATP-binding protein [Alphaproteobacteria bacterium]
MSLLPQQSNDGSAFPSGIGLHLSVKDAPSSSLTLIRRLLRGYVRPHLFSFVSSFLFMGVAAAATGGMAKTIEPLINQLGAGKTASFAVGLGGLVMGLFVTRGIATYFHTVIMNKIGQRIVTDVQQEMHRHLLEADLAFFHANSSGNLISRITNDVTVMRSAVSECLTNAFKGSLTLAFLIGVMFYQDWRLATAAFFVFPLSALFVTYAGRHVRRYATKTQEEMGRFTSLLSQIFQGIRQVKGYGMEAQEHARVQGVTESIYKIALKNFRISALYDPLAELMSGLAITTVLLYGNWRIEEGLTTAGALFSFITAFILAFDPMRRTAKVNSQLQAGLAAAERVFRLLDTRPSIVDSPGAAPLMTKDFGVAIHDVIFRYPDGTLALDHISIKVPHGKTVAIVGPSGAGKSTIINLMPRFYDVDEGSISIGGKDIRSITLKSLRSHIALVSQETTLFDDTVRANIAYGRQNASDSEIAAAAEAASAGVFIRSLPDGYDTIVGEHGVKLSGGQRQRIAIARAMLRNAPVLLLDEATSSLDNESERAVQEALKRLQAGRTTIVVAHRLSTIVDADKIVVIEKGRIVEEGRHAELLALGGVYARLYGMQSSFPA